MIVQRAEFRSRSRKRASAYILILIVSMIVALLGLTGLQVSRIELRKLSGTTTLSEATLLAASAVDLALFEIQNDPSWRTTYISGEWTPEFSVANGSIAFRIVDEVDANLSAGAPGPVRVYGRATIGSTVQICSTVVGSVGPNLLQNADMEDGADTTNWVGETSTLQYTIAQFHGGSRSLYCKSRSNETSGPWQDVTSSITNGGMYETEAWIWSWGGGSRTYRLVLTVSNNVGQTVVFESDATIPSFQWTRVTGIFTPSWTGTATSIKWKVRSVGHAQWFYIDDVQLNELLPGQHATGGTWRREADS